MFLSGYSYTATCIQNSQVSLPPLSLSLYCSLYNMLDSMDAVLVATSVVLAASTIVSVSIQLERQYKTVGRLSLSKCELALNPSKLHRD